MLPDYVYALSDETLAFVAVFLHFYPLYFYVMVDTHVPAHTVGYTYQCYQLSQFFWRLQMSLLQVKAPTFHRLKKALDCPAFPVELPHEFDVDRAK